MGIADDIRPRKPLHSHHGIDDSFRAPVKHKKTDQPNDPEKTPGKLEESREQIETFRHPTSTSLLQEDFFKPQDAIKGEHSNEPKQQPGHIGKKLLIILLFLGTIGFAAYQSYKKSISLYNTDKTSETKEEEYKGEVITQDYTTQSEPAAATTTAESETAAAQQPAAPVIDKGTIKLKVLNGNGISGSAAGIKTQLTDAGFTVSSVTNARTFTYPATIIYYHTDKEAEATLVKDSITGKETSLELSDAITPQHDVVVVVGKK